MPNQEKTPRRTFRCGDLWDQARLKAAANGETLTDVLNRALREYVGR